MPAAPLPNPTPYTCPNCGAGLTQLDEFCPRCGARLTAPARPALGVISVILLALGALIFGGIGACSGLVTYGSLTTRDQEFGQSLLVITIPLLVIGLAGLFFCGRALFRQGRK